MSAGDGKLPGTGFDSLDPVEVLGASGAIMDRLRAPDGRWLLVPEPGLILPANWTPPTDITYVVIDTGVADDHPSLVGRVVQQVNLTSDGLKDENGHGTAVAAILAVDLPGTQIISIKALNDQGQSTVELLNHALRVAEDLLVKRGGTGLINLSAGRRSPSCNHDCPLCTTVRDVWETSHILTVAAAGNEPGVTYCPAKSTISVATPDKWSAPGDLIMVPPNWVPAA